MRIIYLHPVNPEIRKLKEISENLKAGAVYIFPTDTVYALVADAFSKSGVERLYSIKKMDKHKPLSIFCENISEVAHYVHCVPNQAFRLMKKVVPGPFTFIFQANKNIPRVVFTDKKRKEVGIRIPSQIYLQNLLDIHGSPLTSTSVFKDDDFITDIDQLVSSYGHQVDGIIDGGIVEVNLSTILRFNDEQWHIVRPGKGMEELEAFGV